MSKQKTPTYIYGYHPIREVLRAQKRHIHVLYTTKPPSQAFNKLKPILPQKIQIQYVTRNVLYKLADSSEHQGVVASTKPYVYTSTFFTPQNAPYILMLDSIQDPRNLGAILRSAYCTNITSIVLPRRHSAGTTAAALKASAGLAEHLRVYQAASSIQAIQYIKQAGYVPYLATTGGTSAKHITFSEPSCLVVGNEATGISKDILSKGKHITLPQKEADISYNASVAAGILLFLLGTSTNRI